MRRHAVGHWLLARPRPGQPCALVGVGQFECAERLSRVGEQAAQEAGERRAERHPRVTRGVQVDVDAETVLGRLAVGRDDQIVDRAVGQVVHGGGHLAEGDRLVGGQCVGLRQVERFAVAQVGAEVLDPVALVAQRGARGGGGRPDDVLAAARGTGGQPDRQHVGEHAGGAPCLRRPPARHRHPDHGLVGAGELGRERRDGRGHHHRRGGAQPEGETGERGGVLG